MIERKQRLRILQIGFLILGLLIIFFTYLNDDRSFEDRIISEETQEKIKGQLNDKENNGDIFYNIEYSGLDLAGNRYILKSKEAFNNKVNENIINMKLVESVFYFKDGTILNVESDEGIYNNKTLDMKFIDNVRANYEGSHLKAQKADYSNKKSFLIITGDVEVKDIKGTISADSLYFDLKKQTLDIASFKNNKINANINLK